MKQIKQIQIILVSFILLCSFKQNDKLNLVGSWKYWVGFFECTLTLNQDSTYNYTIAGDMINRKSTGIWKAKGKNLILNSDRQKPVDFEVESYYDNTIDGIILKIREDSGEPVIVPRIVFNTASTKIDTSMFDFGGMFHFHNIDSLTSFEIFFVGLNKVKWQMIDTSNVYKIIMMPEKDNYIYQTNEKWQIKGNRLYSPDSKKDNRIFKEKGRINYYLKEKK